jgi:hypothetical protein
MTINGSTPITTYFVLNKKDRSGKTQSRLFNDVLEEMKRQESEGTKAKQPANLKGEDVQDRPRSEPIEDSFIQLLSKNKSKLITAESVETSVSAKQNNDKNVALLLIKNSLSERKVSSDQSTKPSERVSKPRDSMQLLQERSRSRTCELL